jgi:hypothetical protein
MSADRKLSPTSWIHSLKAKAIEPPAHKPFSKISSVGSVATNTKRGHNQETLVADIGDGTDAINFLLVAAGCPAEYRPLIDCLVGLAGDRTEEFEADDLTVAMRARATDEKFTITAGRKWVQRWRKKLIAWQNRKNLSLIVCSPGGENDGIRYKSRYKVNLLWLAAQTLEEARNSSNWHNDPTNALTLAAQNVLEETPQTPAYKQRFRAPRRDDDALLNRNPKTALTLLEDVARILIARGEDVEAFCDTFTGQLKKRMLAVHTTDKNQWTTKESQAGGFRPVPPVVVASEPAPVDKIVHWSSEPDVELALEALQSFEAAGASSFDVTMRDEESGRAKDFETLTGAELPAWLPELLSRNGRKRESLIIRPRGASLIQCDDLASSDLERLNPFSFLTAETSSNNFQAWLAIADDLDAPALADVRARLLPVINADKGASGAMRWPGSLNRKYEPAPLVELRRCTSFLKVGVAELEKAGLLAPQKPPCDSLMLSMPKPLTRRGRAVEPSYELCERTVKSGKKGRVDRSGVDALFAITCFDWGLAFDRVLELLRLKSPKAKSRRDNYAERTTAWAFAQVAARS